MFEFPRFAAKSPRHAAELVRDHPFALVVSAAQGSPVATHLPVILEDPGTALSAGLTGATLLGHMARINPQWRGWTEDTEVLVVFSGPHGYVSPAFAGVDPDVPTWNYAAVHLTGKVELITDEAGVLDVVGRTVRALESPRTPAWSPSPASERVFASLAGQVAAFRVRVREERSNFKLSQDSADGKRDRIRAGLASGPDADARLVELMDAHDPRGGDRA